MFPGCDTGKTVFIGHIIVVCYINVLSTIVLISNTYELITQSKNENFSNNFTCIYIHFSMLPLYLTPEVTNPYTKFCVCIALFLSAFYPI